jgi:hypothetical protein
MRSLTPFIWTPKQPIVLHRYGGPPRQDGLNRWFLFRRVVDLPAAPERAPVKVTADGRYILFVNGERVGRGPVRCNPLYQRYDEYDLAKHLKPGRNILAVLAHTYGADAAFYEMAKGFHNRAFGDGGLWLEGHAETGSRRIPLKTDEQWRVTQSDAWLQDVPRMNGSLGFIEAVDASRLPANWTALDFDDFGWDRARILQAGDGKPWAETGLFPSTPFPTLMPSGIPQLAETPVAAKRIVWMKGLAANPDLPFFKRPYEERFAPLPDNAVSAPEQLLRFEGSDCTIRTALGRDVTVLLDFGRIHTARPRIHVEAKGGEVIEIACSEILPGEWSKEGLDDNVRITPAPRLGDDRHLVQYTARSGDQVFEAFEWSAIRWMQLVVRNAPQGLKIKGLGAIFTHYPVEPRGKFACSDPFLTQLWSTGAYTLMLCMHDAWEDCPSREQRQWLGDATVENLVGHVAFGPSVAPLNAKFILQAAESQRPDGLTQMFAPGDHRTDGLLIPDWTLQWILNAGDHYRLTADLGTIEAVLPSILKALAWFERLLDANGLVAEMPYWHFMDWAYLGREGEACALNAQLAGAFAVAAGLCDACGWEREGQRLRVRARTIADALNARHWDERRGAYVDVVDPETGAQQLKISQHANAAMALWCAPPADRIKRALDRITETKRLTFTVARWIVPTGEELEPENGVVLANTFYSHFLYEALSAQGRFHDALRMIRERFGPMLARGATTLWESFDPTASLCHGFSASPTYQLSRRVLGVSAAAPGFARIAVAPDLADLDAAEGVVPTVAGDVEVKLARDGKGFVAQVKGPKDSPLEFSHAPDATLVKSARTGPGSFEARYESIGLETASH